MLSDQEIQRAARQLAEYRRNDGLADILDKYSELIEDYKRLKSDYEEEREARERYKQRAKGQERDPFALVLIDGSGYNFHETLITNSSDGGNLAAKLLNDTVKASLRAKGLENCSVVVRVYANVSSLSKALAKAELIGREARSLANFIAGFNGAYGLTDFIDGTMLTETVDFKLRALLKLYAENAQCKHIYFAACHDVGYIPELTPYKGNSEKMTLIRASGVGFREEFSMLGLGIEDLPGVFRTTPLDTNATHPSAGATFGNAKNTTAALSAPPPAKASASKALPSEKDGRGSLCRFYPLGLCKYGQKCKNVHVDEGPSTSWRAKESKMEAMNLPQAHTGTPDSPYGSVKRAKRSNGSGSHADSSASGPDISALPEKHGIPTGFIAVNDNDHRLDPFIRPPSPDANSRLQARINSRRLCNNFHLTGACESGDKCEYDHQPLDHDCIPGLELLARSMPCPRRGGCRLENCTHGHICQVTDCKHRHGKTFCKLPFAVHLENYSPARYVPAVAKSKRHWPESPIVSRHISKSPSEEFRSTDFTLPSEDRQSPLAGDPYIKQEDEEEEEDEVLIRNSRMSLAT